MTRLNGGFTSLRDLMALTLAYADLGLQIYETAEKSYIYEIVWSDFDFSAQNS